MLECIIGATNQNSFMGPIMYCCMNKFELMFRGNLFVTIAEIHTLNIDVCVCMHTFFCLFFGFDHFDFFEKAKKVCSIMAVLL